MQRGELAGFLLPLLSPIPLSLLMTWGVNTFVLVKHVDPDGPDSWRTPGRDKHPKQPYTVTAGILGFFQFRAISFFLAGGDMVLEKKVEEKQITAFLDRCFFSLTAGHGYNCICFDSSPHRLCRGRGTLLLLCFLRLTSALRGLQREHGVWETTPWNLDSSWAVRFKELLYYFWSQV